MMYCNENVNNLPHADRKFYDIPTIGHDNLKQHENHPSGGKLCNYINFNLIGRDKSFIGPYGTRTAIYCDYTASGRSLEFIEDYIKDNVLVEYGNTHTTTTVTSLQTTLFRHEARDIIRNSVNASEHDAVIFVGHGCTGAVHKFIHGLNLKEPPIVLVGPYEHHSNLLPWRDLGAKVIRIAESCDGNIDTDHLNRTLQKEYKSGKQVIGCFSAASNVTGILVDVDLITACLHKYGALAVWDYATAAPYVKIDMNPLAASGDGLLQKDAVFISTHKFVGGVQTPGILVVKKKLFKNPVPSVSGGGSVFFVRREAHRYLQEIETREEGGTPAIVESIRAGLVFQLKEAVGSEFILDRDNAICRHVLSAWQSCPNLVLLGATAVPRLPIFSFVIKHPLTGLLLHHNFVCTLLNDLFGIQARGGCACAGPYAQDILGIDESLAKTYEDLLAENSQLDRVHLRRYHEYSQNEIIRPGFSRLNIPYFMDQDHVNFVIEAVKLVSEHGWKLLPQYNFNPETGEWRHRNHQVFKDRKWLGHISYKDGLMKVKEPAVDSKASKLPGSFAECIEEAVKLFELAEKVKPHIGDQSAIFSDEAAHLRWFLLPSEALTCLNKPSMVQKKSLPFSPVVYPLKSISLHNSTDTQMYPLDTLNASSMVKKKDLCNIENFEDGMKKCLETGYDKPLLLNYDLSKSSPSNEPLTTSNQMENENENTNKIHHTCTENKSEYDNEDNGLSESNIPSHSITEGEENTCQLYDNTTAQNVKVNVIETDDENTGKKELSMENDSSACSNGLCFVKRDKSQADTDPPVAVIHKWHAPPKHIFKPMCEAIQQYQMICDGDKVLVCLSGGKDSLSLLHSLRQYRFYAKQKGIHFDLGAVTVDPLTSAYDPSPLKGYLQQLNLPYFYEEQNILDSAMALPDVASICAYCSRMKRGRLYHAARREGYNVLAMGQHLDDLAESFLMSIFHNGLLRTMKVSYSVQQQDLRVIRPFAFVREKELRCFAEEKKLPIIAENCPACFEAPKERHRMKQLLAAQEVLHPRLFHSLQAALTPIMGINKTGVNIKSMIQQLNDFDAQDEEES